MIAIIASLIIIRPFISSLAYPVIDLIFSGISIVSLIIWLVLNKAALRLRNITYPVGLFIAGLSVSLIGAADMANSILEIYKIIPCILIFMAATALDRSQKKNLVFAVICSALTVCALALYQYIFGFGHLQNYFTLENITSPVANRYLYSRRVFFPFITPNALGGYCAVILPLAISEKRLYWAVIPLSIVLFLTQSLGALLALLAGVYIFILLLSPKIKPGWITLITSLLAVFGIIFWIRLTSVSPEAQVPGFFRIQYWRDTLAVIRSHPLLGAGIGNMDLRASIYTHNFFLQLWAETGILGITGFIWICAAVLQRSLRRYYSSPDLLTALLMCSSAVFLLHNLIDFTFFLPEASFVWWALMGLLAV